MRNAIATPDREPPEQGNGLFVLMSRLYGGRDVSLALPGVELRTAARRRPSGFSYASQNEMRAFSWNCRGPIEVVVIVDELVGTPPVPKATPVFGSPKLGWLKIL